MSWLEAISKVIPLAYEIVLWLKTRKDEHLRKAEAELKKINEGFNSGDLTTIFNPPS